MYIKAEKELSDFYKEIIADELNVKSVEFKDDVSSFTTYEFKPQLRTVGPKYGKLLGGIRGYLANIDGNAAKAELEANGKIVFDVNGEAVELAEEDLLIQMIKMEGYVTEQDKGVTVVLDTNLTDELIEEGFVREIISKIQTMRKEAGFEVMDKIKVSSQNNAKIAEIIEKNGQMIKNDVLCEQIEVGMAEGYTKEWNINGEDVILGVQKL
jgi:isoleucyl-tRNA synthetase